MDTTANDTANNTTYGPFFSPIIVYLDGIIGLLAALTNIFILVVFFVNKRLLNSSSLLVGLTMAHALNGVIHFIISFYVGSDLEMVPVLHCIKIVWPVFYIATYQLLPILLALNGIERLLALGTPAWYRVNCKHQFLWKVIGLTFGYGLLCMVLTCIKAAFDIRSIVSSMCIPSDLLSLKYTIYSVNIPAVLGGICAGVCSASAVRIGRRRISKMPTNSESEIRRVSKQLRLTKCLLMISIIDFACVVVPNFIFILFHTGLWVFPLGYTGHLTIIYCSDSIWNILAFVLFNREFKQASLSLIRCKTPVAPMSQQRGLQSHGHTASQSRRVTHN